MKLSFMVQGIPEREALPLRALPFVAGIDPATSQRNLPASLVVESAIQAAIAWPPGIPSLKVYFMDTKGTTQKASIDYLAAAMPQTNFQPEDDEPVATSAMKLPGELFVFADEAQAFIDWLFPYGSCDGECRDRLVLNMAPALPKEIASAIVPSAPPSNSIAQTDEEQDDGMPSPKVGWKKSVVAVWEELLKKNRRKPTVEELVCRLERDDPEGVVIKSGIPDELKWLPRSGTPKNVRRRTIEDFIGELPGFRA